MDILRQVAAVALVLGLLAALLWRIRRGGFATLVAVRPGVRRIQAVERVALGPSQSLHLIRVGDRGLLVASSPSGCALLHSVPWQECEWPGEASK
jgi:flagellar biosynthetic protein FliO